MIKELKKIATGFTKGLLQKNSHKDKCFIVSLPLNSYLQFLGYESELIEGEVRNGKNNHHYWIKVKDLIIDATANQFKKPNGSRMPKIYVGIQPNWYKELS